MSSKARLGSGIEPIHAARMLSAPAPRPGTHSPWQHDDSAGAEVVELAGPEWQLRASYRDPCIGLPYVCDMWLLVLERTDGSAKNRWGIVMLYNDLRPDGWDPWSAAATSWERLNPAGRSMALKRALAGAITGPTPEDLLDRLARASSRWPTMKAEHAKPLRLHDPTMAACRTLLSINGPEGDAVRMLAALGGFTAPTGRGAGIALRTRIVRHAVEESLRTYADEIRARYVELHYDRFGTRHPLRIDQDSLPQKLLRRDQLAELLLPHGGTTDARALIPLGTVFEAVDVWFEAIT